MKLDVDVINQTVGTLKAAADAAEAAKSMDNIAHVKGKVVDMLDLILRAHGAAVQTQAQLLMMLQENFELKNQISSVNQWQNTAERYELKDFGGNTFAYSLRTELADQEPPHLLCPNCFQLQRKSILQFSHDTPSNQKLYNCSACTNQYMLGHRSRARATRSSDPGGWF